ncbi:hypothetical protein NS506_05970 [Nocardia seriolae]|uniref:DUF6597 domain-containing protein n=1 Tax=Nocardia seriolae TaxID=37332 RepID=A0ABC9Z4N5_9NOCA|nr:DUF6597 domain-containing transcriptional factor [Nocardia seriolae]APB00007.1 hypothetical protein NS506_05970 [Nocardia seriolae]WKY54851.1 hypothetical protein Q5P07_12925 [Nocardia seriolae]WNJ56952.1 DUF6597 domain-containing transcriptional factor [Nocardia seriolae]BAW08261.1 conserved hypothetical protein [Nocardia seriolae]BEK89696.1 hypothetical protein NSERKGN1266_56470 [Nocardia seriolae]
MSIAQLPASVVTADDLEDRLDPPDSLRPWITEIAHIPTVRPAERAFTHVPQAVTTIVLRTEESGRRDALVVGPRTRASYANPSKPAGCTRIRLAPGAAQPLLGLLAADLTNRVTMLADLPGTAADLAAALTELASDDIVAFLESELPKRLSEDPTRRAHCRLLGTAVAAMDTAAPSPTWPPPSPSANDSSATCSPPESVSRPSITPASPESARSSPPRATPPGRTWQRPAASTTSRT